LDSDAIRKALEEWFADCDSMNAEREQQLADSLLRRAWTSSDDLTAYWGIDFLVSHADDTRCFDDRLRAFLEAQIS
jgi:hypothetical protein